MFYDAASKTASRGALPQDEKPRRPTESPRRSPPSARARQARPGVDAVRRHADHRPPAGRATRSGSRPKDDGGLLGAAELAWDAVRGVPLRAAIYAQGSQDPVLELEATDVSYGAIPAGEDRHHAARGREGDRDRPADRRRRQGQADPRRGRRRGRRSGSTSRSPPRTSWPGCRAAACASSGSATSGRAAAATATGLGAILVFQTHGRRGQAGRPRRARRSRRSTSTARPAPSSPPRWARW